MRHNLGVQLQGQPALACNKLLHAALFVNCLFVLISLGWFAFAGLALLYLCVWRFVCSLLSCLLLWLLVCLSARFPVIVSWFCLSVCLFVRASLVFLLAAWQYALVSGSALRVSPAETRLTVYRRLDIGKILLTI